LDLVVVLVEDVVLIQVVQVVAVELVDHKLEDVL
tara:strand:+ start:196 stop:297 length:102 start_codon:yes stop_codon:yes gene_type:complete